MPSALTPKQERFAAEYVTDLNATQAAIRAGYSKLTAYSAGQRLLKHVEVKLAIDARRADLAHSLDVTQERVIKEYARLAFTDMRDAARWGDEIGLSLVPSDDLTPDVAAAVKAVRVVKTITREGKGDRETERLEHRIEMHDKKGALDSLAKHLGLFVEGPGSTAIAAVVIRTTRDLRGS